MLDVLEVRGAQVPPGIPGSSGALDDTNCIAASTDAGTDNAEPGPSRPTGSSGGYMRSPTGGVLQVNAMGVSGGSGLRSGVTGSGRVHSVRDRADTTPVTAKLRTGM